MFENLKKINFILKKKQKVRLFLISFGGIISSFFEVIGIGSVGPIILGILSPNNLENYLYKFGFENLISSYDLNIIIIFFFILFVLAFTFRSVFSYFIASKIIKEGTEIQKHLRLRFIKKFNSLTLEKISEIKSSEVFHQIGHVTRIFAQNTVVKIFTLISDLLIFITIIFLMFITSVKLFSLIILILLGSYFFYFIFVRRKIEIFGSNFGEADEKFVELTKQMINGFKTLKILQQQNKFLSYFEENNQKSGKSEYNYESILLLPKVILEISFIIIIASIFIFSIILDGSINPNSVTLLGVFGIASARSIPLIYNIFNSIGNILGSTYSINKIYEQIKIGDEFFDTQSNFDGEDIYFENLNFVDVNFNFKNGKKVFENFNIKIKKNEFVAIVGPSGVGKTTLIDLFCGLIKPKTGQILIGDKINIHKNLYQWQKKISYIPQQNFIFKGSILENITFNKELKDTDESKLKIILEQVKLDKFIQQNNLNYDYIISEDGKNLSGGQAQRISLARSLYFNKEIIVLDESLNSLNVELQEEILQEFLKLKNQITLILITHNKDNLRYFDQIINLEEIN